MKHSLVRASLLAALAITSFASVSCETTGDPSTGGIFWSPQKAQARLDERQDRLNHIQNRTERAREQAREKEHKIKKLKEEKKDEDKKN